MYFDTMCGGGRRMRLIQLLAYFALLCFILCHHCMRVLSFILRQSLCSHSTTDSFLPFSIYFYNFPKVSGNKSFPRLNIEIRPARAGERKQYIIEDSNKINTCLLRSSMKLKTALERSDEYKKKQKILSRMLMQTQQSMFRAIHRLNLICL